MAYSPLANPTATLETLGRFGLDAKYRLGQNFLIDDNVIGNIIRMAQLDGVEFAGDCVLEIGPGIGTLTVALLDHASVVSVERDRDLLPVLAETTAFNSDRFSLINADALKCTRADIEQACAQIGAPLPTMLVANLPYAIAATVILDWLERFDFLQSMVVMVQSEVADRIAAQMGTKDYGAYSIKLGMYARTVDRFQVAPTCFHPAPRVESAVVRLERVQLDASPEVIRAACEVADAAFAQRRKNIRNSMKSKFETATIDELLAQVGIAPTVRGETLSRDTYIEMGAALCSMRQDHEI